MNELIENKTKSEILAEAIAGLQYGDVIMHTHIAELIDEPYPSPKYSSTIAKARKLLLKNYGRVIKNIQGDGYRVVEPDDYVDIALNHYKGAFNAMQKGVDTIQKAPLKDMTAEGQKAYTRVRDRSIILIASMEGARVELNRLAERNHPMLPQNVGRK